MKPAFCDVVGNLALRNRLRDEILNGKLSHAYILEGARGTGKHMLALRIAAALSCEHASDASAPLPCMRCASCRKILSLNSPDVIFVNRGDRATMGVDTVREIRQDVLTLPNDVETKVYVIEDAHLMTSQAQNAFLLTLEEPPSYVHFLLLCESVAPLLDTIRSRAPTLRTEAIAPQEIESHLRRVNADAEALAKTSARDFSEIVSACDGSIGRAIELLDAKTRKPILARRELARDFVQLCSSRQSHAAAQRLLNAIAQKREETVENLNAILLCLRDLLLCKQTEHAPLCFFGNREEACALAYTFTTPVLLSLCDGIAQTISRVRASANIRLTLTDFFTEAGLL
ncbi:MAG: hypothetical protein IKJ35_04225 [Clostridia bacterium]|nr:hypothetical protein [Clostridia bacterium]